MDDGGPRRIPRTRVQGRHRAHPSRARHPLLVTGAGILVVTVSIVLTGTVLLHHLRGGEAPFAPVPTRAAPSIPASAVAAQGPWGAAAESPITTLHLAQMHDCGLPVPAREVQDPPLLAEHADGISGCLDELWSGVLAEAGIPFAPVRIAVVTPRDGPEGPCGRLETAVPAAYCAADRTIVVSSEILREGPEPSDWTEQRIVAVIAHEYGHHLQNLTGLLDEVAAAPAPIQAEGTRRLESMATCLGALSQGRMTGGQQVTQAFYDARRDPATFRDDVEHGTGATQALWAQRGYDSPGDTGACATFAAPPHEVE